MTTYPPPDQSYQQQSPQTNFIPQYAEPTQTHSPRAPLPPGFYPNTDPSLQQTSKSLPVRTPQSNGDHKNANRLRKACDSCSIRKVKCDESGPPCKACIALDIPCTFDRPSKRRGPPNRLAESIKKQRIETPAGTRHSLPTSPTHAAQTLASFAQQQVLSADAICPSPVLHLLIDDYFTFIHPLVPVPHEPSFRQALEHRQDLISPTFLALMASMIGCLTASFPRRPRQHFKSLGLEHMYPSSISFIDRCQRVSVEAHGAATFNRAYTVHDAIISYLLGLANLYTSQRQPAMLYIKEALSIVTTLGLHKVEKSLDAPNGVSAVTTSANGVHLDGQRQPPIDYVVQELDKRTFWVVFVGVKSLQQLGVSPFELNIPPSTRSDPYPPLPLEIDDAYLTPTHIVQQPDGHISELVGFNINVKSYLMYSLVSLDELCYGVDELVDWERQKRELEQSLDSIKRLLESLPPKLVHIQAQPSNDTGRGHEYPEPGAGGTRPSDNQSTEAITTIEERVNMQQDIQKANIHASQLGTRSWLLRKFYTLSLAHAKKLEKQLDTLHVTISAEHTSIFASFSQMISTIQKIHLESNGTALIPKVHAIVSNLLSIPFTQKDPQASRSRGHLHKILTALAILEHAARANEARSEEDEESKSRAWANLREIQEQFLSESSPSNQGR